MLNGSGALRENQIKEIMRVLSYMPIVNLTTHLQSSYVSGEEALLKVDLSRMNKPPLNGAYTPRFPKRKDEGWWLVLGDPETGELIALRRLNFPYKNTKTTLSFDVPDESGIYIYNLYFMSDTYLGLDQQYEVKFEVK